MSPSKIQATCYVIAIVFLAIVIYKVSTGRFDVFLDLSVACSIIGISETQNLQMDLHWRDLAKGLVISKTGKIFTIAGFLFLVLHLAKSVL